jgi:MoCo/4Fe-4S cofactor protein with predicted Tat translocation signal
MPSLRPEDMNITRDDLMNGHRPGQRATILAPRGDDPVQQQQNEVFDAELNRRLDIGEVREKLAGKEGPAFWQSMEELSEHPDFTELMEREFPRMAPRFSEVDRRGFLKLMGASMAMAGLTACTKQPTERIVPYVRAPEEFIPSKSTFFATSMTLGGYAMGLLAESHMGRPTKIEGNELHPASLGSSDAFAQAAILGLYDPDRSKKVLQQGVPSTWAMFRNAMVAQLQMELNTQGAGLRIVTEPVTSPSIAAWIHRVMERFPRAKWVPYDAIGRDHAKAGAQAAFGEHVDTIYHFDRADVVVALDVDFLGEGPAHVRYARDFSARRNMAEDGVQMNRLYAVECVPSMTGATADHAIPMRASDIEKFARAIARYLGIDAPGTDLDASRAMHAKLIADDLKKAGSKAAIVVGERQPAAVHALAHALHDVLGAAGDAVTYIDPVEVDAPERQSSLKELAEDMEAGRVRAIAFLDVNPAYNAPADLNFASLMEQVPFKAHLGLYNDETAQLCHWHVPMTHFLEGWGDARAFDGTLSIIQPLIEPLYDCHTVHEVLAATLGDEEQSAYDLVKSYWQENGLADEKAWRRVLHDGVWEGSAFPAKDLRAKTRIDASHTQESGLELVFSADTATWDGRFANNAWLQEMPRALSKLTWDNVVMMAPSTAEQLNVAKGDVVTLTVEDRTVNGPVWVMPGHAPDSVSVQLGYGRTAVGAVGNGIGFNAYALRSSSAPWIQPRAQIALAGERYPLATTQRHHQMDGIKDRNLVRIASLDYFLKNPAFAHKKSHDPKEDQTMFPLYDYSQGYQWGMTINLNTCIGCNACLVACQAENNIPVVGKNEVANGREMHWIRIDRYYSGDLDKPDTHMQPVTCMHCEKAPCEPVCPVAATVHSADGLNQMVYNRCIGTRYCSNNCPYKVRRFNFLQYTDETTPQLKLLRNPNVTVRTRGVMEKCTYCVQRISKKRIAAERDHRTLQDGEVQTACQQACPTRAIVFGDINNPDSEVTRMKAHPLNYALLGELNVRPRTTYLAKVKNTHPAWAGEPKA